MMLTSFYRIGTICALVLCVTGIPSSSSSTGTFEDANFEDREVPVSVAGLNDFLDPVSVEKGLAYNSLVLISGETAGLATNPTPPHSEPNAIVTSVFQQAVNGTASITVLFRGSKYRTFDFKDFWFGCGLTNAQGIVDMTAQCTVFVAGFRQGQEVDTASYTFTPNDTRVLQAPMIEAVLPGTFAGVDTVTLIQSDPTTQALVMDNLDYILHP